MKDCSEVPPAAATECPASSTDELLADIGHELRSPLTSILAFADALHDEVFGPLNEGQKQALLSIRECVQRETGLIADMIDLRRLEAGTGSLNPVPCRVREVVDRVLGQVSGLVADRRVDLAAAIVPEDLEVHLDARRLEQMVTQLLITGVLAADVESMVRLWIDGTVGFALTVEVMPPGYDSDPAWTGASNADVEQRLRKLKPIGLALLRAILGLHGGSLLAQEGAQGCISLTTYLPNGV